MLVRFLLAFLWFQAACELKAFGYLPFGSVVRIHSGERSPVAQLVRAKRLPKGISESIPLLAIFFRQEPSP